MFDVSATKTLYETDFAEWAARTATLIRSGRFGEIDAESVAEEIEGLSKSEQSAVRSHLRILLTHKIKQLIQPERDSVSWRVSIANAREALEDRLEASPSLRPHLQAGLQKIYRRSVTLALLETELEHAAVPDECPWDLDALLSE
jgi:hypothetical protein